MIYSGKKKNANSPKKRIPWGIGVAIGW